jgi:hypothetical protein
MNIEQFGGMKIVRENGNTRRKPAPEKDKLKCSIFLYYILFGFMNTYGPGWRSRYSD